MGERLVGLRDANGRLGLLQEACAHRCASLFFGRNEPADSSTTAPGLRCAYHGWKYDLDGRCIDMPNEPAFSRFKERISIKAYTAEERAGIVWAYLGPPEHRPRLPELEWVMVADSQRYVSKRVEFCNFAQAMEGGIDSSHVSFLHSDGALWNPDLNGLGGQSHRISLMGDTAPRFFIEPTTYGMLIGARRVTPESDDMFYWRVTQWLMPCYTLIPRDGQGTILAHAWVPIDDQRCWAWSISYNPDRDLTKRETDFYRGGGSIHASCAPGSYVPVQSADNDYQIDRLLQRTVSWSGIRGIAMEDTAMQESMGPIVNRENEHLGSADAALVAARNRLMSEARALQAGGLPSGLDPMAQRVRSGSTVLPAEADWVHATKELRQADTKLYAAV